MQSVVKIANLNSQKDIEKIKKFLSKIEGILAVEFKQEIKSLVIVYDEIYIKLYEICDLIEEVGYFTV